MLMDNSQSAGRGRAAPLPINRLVGADELLLELWPDERSRPSLRWLKKQKKRRTLPFVVLGGRVKFCPEMVLAVVGQKFTVRPPDLVHHPALKGSLPAPKELIGAKGLLETLASRLGVQRSLRWLRERQRGACLAFLVGDRVGAVPDTPPANAVSMFRTDPFLFRTDPFLRMDSR
jgi:hypothetical protein